MRIVIGATCIIAGAKIGGPALNVLCGESDAVIANAWLWVWGGVLLGSLGFGIVISHPVFGLSVNRNKKL